MKETENLVVGLGIAGVNLCHQLEKAGKSFIVLDRIPQNAASLIAGGIYNPVVLKRKVKSWQVDVLFPILVDTYSELESLLNESFLYHNFPILKPISSAEEITEWQQEVNEERLAPYVGSVSESRPNGPFKECVISHVTINGSGFIRIKKLIEAYRKRLQKKGLLIKDEFDYNKLSVNDSVEYKGVKAKRIIFCEGRFVSENPYFNWLPYSPTKGQMLTVKVNQDLDPTKIYNQQFLFFPTEEKNVFRLGATYSWNETDENPTEKATVELIEKVKKVLDVDLTVLDAQAAIRPTVADRRPTIGVHPTIENVFLFNGMGSKGVMLAPTFAKQLVDFIYQSTEVNKEVNLHRFTRKHFRKSVL